MKETPLITQHGSSGREENRHLGSFEREQTSMKPEKTNQPSEPGSRRRRNRRPGNQRKRRTSRANRSSSSSRRRRRPEPWSSNRRRDPMSRKPWGKHPSRKPENQSRNSSSRTDSATDGRRAGSAQQNSVYELNVEKAHHGSFQRHPRAARLMR